MSQGHRFCITSRCGGRSWGFCADCDLLMEEVDILSSTDSRLTFKRMVMDHQQLLPSAGPSERIRTGLQQIASIIMQIRSLKFSGRNSAFRPIGCARSSADQLSEKFETAAGRRLRIKEKSPPN
jgi:hypothetical protein